MPRAWKELMVDQWLGTRTGLICNWAVPVLAESLWMWKRGGAPGAVLSSGLVRSWHYLQGNYKDHSRRVQVLGKRSRSGNKSPGAEGCSYPVRRTDACMCVCVSVHACMCTCTKQPFCPWERQT